MVSVFQIKKHISKLSYEYKIDIFNYTGNLLKQSKPKLSLSEAADKMKSLYINDTELTAFSTLESDYYEEK